MNKFRLNNNIKCICNNKMTKMLAKQTNKQTNKRKTYKISN